LLAFLANRLCSVHILLGIVIEGLLATQRAEVVCVSLKLGLRRGLGIDFHITYRITFHGLTLLALPVFALTAYPP